MNSTTLNRFSYFYFEESTLKVVSKCSELPDDEDLEFCRVCDAISYLQKLGCIGLSQHKIQSEYHRLCLAVLRFAVESIGEVFPVVLRGVRSDRPSYPDSEHLVLFGTRDPDVAAFYGDMIKTYRNVRGLRVEGSAAKSVLTDDWSHQDDEIIFFPSTPNG